MSHLPIIKFDGDTWRVLGTGSRDQDSIMAHLASTTRYKVGRNARLPLQITDYVPLHILNEGRIAAGMEPLT